MKLKQAIKATIALSLDPCKKIWQDHAILLETYLACGSSENKHWPKAEFDGVNIVKLKWCLTPWCPLNETWREALRRASVRQLKFACTATATVCLII